MKADRRRLAPALVLCLLVACGGVAPVRTAGNVLLLIADDLGTDKLAAYAEHPDPPSTPTRLLASMDPELRARTTVIFVGDNGTLKAVVTPPRIPDHAKLTLYEGGVNVPLIIAGPGVVQPGSETDALVHVADIFSTLAELAEVDPAALSGPDGRPLRIDGRSLIPQLRDPTTPGHEFVYEDVFAPNGPGPYRRDQRMLRDARWKLIAKPGETGELFDLEGRRDDGPDRMRDSDPDLSAIAERLRAEMSRTAAELDADRAGS